MNETNSLQDARRRGNGQRRTRIDKIIADCHEQRRPPTFDEARILAVHYSTQDCFADANGRIEVDLRKLERLIRENEKHD